MALGIDMATDSGKYAEKLAAAGVQWVGRYYRNPTSRYPPLTPSEARLLSLHKIHTVALWEAASTKGDYFKYIEGVDDATTAYRQAHIVGQPIDAPIYFAVDYDAAHVDIPTIRKYFEGVKKGFLTSSAEGGGVYKVGVYGSGLVCQALMDSQHVDFSWLAASRAWAGNSTFSSWNIKQSLDKVAGLESINHDSNQTQGIYGGFTAP